MTQFFDLTKQSIDDIGIFQAWSNSNCYIAEHKDKSKIYEGFILRDGQLARTVCNITFHPSSVSRKYVPRLEFKIIFTKTGLEKKTEKDVRISFSSVEDGYQEFWKMVSFLSGFKDLVDIGDFKRTYRVIDSSEYIVGFKSKDEGEQAKELSKLIRESGLTDGTIKKALSDTREKTVMDFEKLLNNPTFIADYRKKYSITENGDEAIWHHFLKTNSWILGLTVDVRFIRDLISEVDVGVRDTDGKGSPQPDILGIHDYTVLVELKKPNTKIFSDLKKNTARTTTWSFSDDFIDGISQCLSQKFVWDKDQKIKDLINPSTQEVIDQTLTRTIDPKAIFVIGDKNTEIPESSREKNIHIKRDTFELFRRNNRNVEIITFDELYERAYCIVHGVIPSQISIS